MILRTERLTLRPLATDDAAALHDMMSNAEVMAYWDSAEISDVAITAEILGRQLDEAAEGRAIFWAIERATDKGFVGTCDISDIDRWHRRGEIGFMLSRAAWGQGYGAEAMFAVISHAAQSLRLKRLSARTHFGNAHSVALLSRLGFRREGVLRSYVERAGERRDCLLFGLLL